MPFHTVHGVLKARTLKWFAIPFSSGPCSVRLHHGLTWVSLTTLGGPTRHGLVSLNRELPDVRAGFRKGRGTRDQIANVRWIIEKARELQKNIYLCFIDYVKALDCMDHNKLWKILKEMGIPDHLTCLLRNLYAGQKATVRTGRGTTDWFQIWKGVCQGCILSPCLFNLYAEYIMRNAGLDEAELESRFLGEISITSNMQMTPPLWQKVKRN